jgi:geranylgeranyl pyrophosphate synthase
LATGCLFTAQLALGELATKGLSWSDLHQIQQGFNRASLGACTGQHDDLAWQIGENPPEPDAWFSMVRRKSGDLLAWACWVGAAIAQTGADIQNCLGTYGSHLGILLQIADDFKDLWLVDNSSDLYTGRMTLPVIYAQFVAEPEKRVVLEGLLLKASHGDHQAGTLAREMITALGAQKYVLAAACLERKQAVSALDCLAPSPATGKELTALVDRVFPALRLFGDRDRGS